MPWLLLRSRWSSRFLEMFGTVYRADNGQPDSDCTGSKLTARAELKSADDVESKGGVLNLASDSVGESKTSAGGSSAWQPDEQFGIAASPKSATFLVCCLIFV